MILKVVVMSDGSDNEKCIIFGKLGNICVLHLGVTITGGLFWLPFLNIIIIWRETLPPIRYYVAYVLNLKKITKIIGHPTNVPKSQPKLYLDQKVFRYCMSNRIFIISN